MKMSNGMKILLLVLMAGVLQLMIVELTGKTGGILNQVKGTL